MKVKRLRKGVYKVEDNQGTWIARGGFDGTDDGRWVANDCKTEEECHDYNSWAISFDTFKQLKEYSQSF